MARNNRTEMLTMARLCIGEARRLRLAPFGREPYARDNIRARLDQAADYRRAAADARYL